MDKKNITIEYARQKLGIKAQNMTDKQITDLLVMLRLLCNKTIDGVIEKSCLSINYEN
ncbi:MAG: hypothetical protein HY429_00765 [Candidatus Levybacteria bacterium]|nr:hypothetical protein [Candidatus Levybacteria bacterium]